MPTLRSPLLLAFAGGGLLGAVLGFALRGGAEAPPIEGPTPAGTVEAAGTGRPNPPTSPTARTDAATAGDTRTAAEGDPVRHAAVGATPDASLFSPALRAWSEAEARRGWSTVRADAIPDDVLARILEQIERSLHTWPASLGEGAAKERSEADQKAAAAATGDALTIVTTLEPDDSAVAKLVRDGARFADLFRPRFAITTAQAAQISGNLDDAITDGTVLTWGAGVYRVSGLMQHKDPFPKDVTLKGAGMDVTLLVIDQIDTRGVLERFAIQDCTVYSGLDGFYLTDLRSKPAVMSFARVRFVGFDIGAGSSVVFAFDKGGVLHATDCRFEGGYGDSPGHGNLIDARSGTILCRFDRCTFSRIALEYLSPLNAVFRECVMTELTQPVNRTNRVRLENCRIDVLEPPWWHPPERLARLSRNLDDLFPNWRQRLGR